MCVCVGVFVCVRVFAFALLVVGKKDYLSGLLKDGRLLKKAVFTG